MEEHNLMSCLQHGFRKGHSCETQLLLTLDDLFMSYNKKTQVDVGVLDFSRAFDTVPHERLLGKLAHYGIKGPIQQWIRAFRTDRTMWVTVDGASSPATRVLSWVPQGTVMGPLLFLIYINDLPSNVSPGTTVRLFADDCLVYRDITSEEDQLTLQKDLAALQDWAEKWGMRFNPKKCNILRISRRRPRDRFYTMCGEILQEVQEAKYLGVTISNNLKWGNTSVPRPAERTALCTLSPEHFDTAQRTPDNLPTSPSLDLPWNTAAQSGTRTMERIQTA